MNNFLLFFLLSFLIEGVFSDSVSVKNGESVTLHTGLTKIHEKDVLEWRFGDLLDRIVELRKDCDLLTEEDVSGRFRGRLKPDCQTGDLTISNITTEHAGPYEISNNDITLWTIRLIVVSADPVKTVSVMVGDSVTLNTNVTEPQRYDVIQWRSEHLNSPIAENNRKTRHYFTSNTTDDEGFRDRLQLDYWTGSLTIRNIRTEHAGVYEVDIISSKHTIHKSFTVTVSGEMKSVSVMKGENVTLHTGLTEIQTDDLMQWKFGHSQIAEIYKVDDRFSTSDGVPDGRFRGRLELNNQTGSLNIINTTTEHAGVYELKIINSRCTVLKSITVTVTVTVTGLSTAAIAGISVLAVLLGCVAVVMYCYKIYKVSEVKEWIYKWGIQSVIEGERLTLTPDEVHEDDKLQWIFRGSCIADRKSAADGSTVDYLPDGRFRDRLKLNPQTGSLTITDTRTTDTGVYELLITRSGKSSIKRFSVSVFDKPDEIKNKPVKEGGSVTLETDVTDIQKDGQIQWKLGYTLLAKVKRGTKKISPSADKIFKGRLDLDHQTGSLTIKRIRPTDAGIYMLYKIKGGNLKTDLFKVEVESTHNRNKPEEKTSTKNNPEESVPLSVKVIDPTDNRNNPKKKIPRGDAFEEFPDSRL